jgi:mono/diheme cytochrome c family protein
MSPLPALNTKGRIPLGVSPQKISTPSVTEMASAASATRAVNIRLPLSEPGRCLIAIGIDLKQIIKAALPLLWILVSMLFLTACSNQPDAPSEPGSDQERGRAVYVANCTACHNSNPSKDGTIGPAIKGSRKELIEARVLRSGYPENYNPKRHTKIMPQFPFLEHEIPYLAAYLSSEPARQNEQ